VNENMAKKASMKCENDDELSQSEFDEYIDSKPLDFQIKLVEHAIKTTKNKKDKLQLKKIRDDLKAKSVK
jgi:hypothetical protein